MFANIVEPDTACFAPNKGSERLQKKRPAGKPDRARNIHGYENRFTSYSSSMASN